MTRLHFPLLLLALLSGLSEVLSSPASPCSGSASKSRGTVRKSHAAVYNTQAPVANTTQAVGPNYEEAVSNTQPAIPATQAGAPNTQVASTEPAVPNHLAVVPKSREADVPVSSNATISQCTPMSEDFQSSSLPPSWIQLSSNPKASEMNPGGGVNLALTPPAGPVTISADGRTNDKLGDGSTLNSTFSFLYGRVSMTFAASDVRGAIAALVLFGTTTHDEIDIEILGGDSTHWQTNVFRPAPGETTPLYGVFGGMHTYPNGSSTAATHTYTIDWSPSGITWLIDGNAVRTLTPDQTLRNGQRHFPSARSRIQVGLWDASSPQGTSEWANGPIPWTQRQRKPVTATIKSVKVECPY